MTQFQRIVAAFKHHHSLLGTYLAFIQYNEHNVDENNVDENIENNVDENIENNVDAL